MVLAYDRKRYGSTDNRFSCHFGLRIGLIPARERKSLWVDPARLIKNEQLSATLSILNV